eukprot:scaffold83613_cov34-Tisochrysis_lutea.AAC.1
MKPDALQPSSHLPAHLNTKIVGKVGCGHTSCVSYTPSISNARVTSYYSSCRKRLEADLMRWRWHGGTVNRRVSTRVQWGEYLSLRRQLEAAELCVGKGARAEGELEDAPMRD